MNLLTRNIDVANVLACYMHFLGDTARTAVAANTTEEIVLQLSREHDWPSKLESWQKVRLATKDDCEEKEINRTQNLIQARRLRTLADRVITSLIEGENEDLVRFFTRTDPKTGDTVAETKPLVDIARTVEIVHALTYRALGDKQSDTKEGPKSEETALAVAKALNTVLDRLPGPPAPIKVAQVLDV